MNDQGKQDMETSALPPTHLKSLWILACQMDGCHAHRLVPLYAVSREDAEQQAQEWQEAQAYDTVRISLRAFPDGFVMCRKRLPGIIE